MYYNTAVSAGPISFEAHAHTRVLGCRHVFDPSSNSLHARRNSDNEFCAMLQFGLLIAIAAKTICARRSMPMLHR